MRFPFLALLLLAPAALAQVPGVPLVALTVEDPPMVRPLQGPVTANVTLRVSCALAADPPGAPVAYKVESAPPWATTTLSPATDVVDPASCEGGYATRTAVLGLAASDQAPAFRATPVRVSATVGSSGRQQTATAEANVTADYFSILDVVAVETSKSVAPGAEVAFPVRLTNLGNARTRVHVELENATEGIAVARIGPLELGSKQQGDLDTTAEATVRVRAHDADGIVNRADAFTLLIRAEHAMEPARQGDTARLSFVVTTRNAPGPGLALLAAGLAVAAYAIRRA